MSKSALEILSNLQPAGVKMPTPAGQIENSEGLFVTVAGSSINKKEIQDNYYNDMKLDRTESLRNGTGYSIKGTGLQRYYDPREDSFMLEGAIDPRKIRQRTDPSHALPDTFNSGNILAKYKLDDDSYRAYDNTGLLKKAYQSYMNELYHITPPPQQTQPMLKGQPLM